MIQFNSFFYSGTYKIRHKHRILNSTYHTYRLNHIEYIDIHKNYRLNNIEYIDLHKNYILLDII